MIVRTNVEIVSTDVSTCENRDFLSQRATGDINASVRYSTNYLKKIPASPTLELLMRELIFYGKCLTLPSMSEGQV